MVGLIKEVIKFANTDYHRSLRVEAQHKTLNKRWRWRRWGASSPTFAPLIAYRCLWHAAALEPWWSSSLATTRRTAT